MRLLRVYLAWRKKFGVFRSLSCVWGVFMLDPLGFKYRRLLHLLKRDQAVDEAGDRTIERFGELLHRLVQREDKEVPRE